MLKYAQIGFGGLGKTHFRNTEEIHEKHNDVQLVAICDVDPNSFGSQTATNLGNAETSLELSKYNLYTSVDEMLEKEELDFVISAIPTYLHDEIAIKVMEKGIHVFSEKPMAISLERAQKMIDAANANNVKLMIGHCVRYNREYAVVKELVDSKKYGNVVKAEFSRISPTPTWSWENWYMDEAKSGGAALDLHVHDVDYINYLFGKPKSVVSYATNNITKHDSIVTSYIYGDKTVIATGDWGMQDKYPFSCSFCIKFEKATVEFKDWQLKLYVNGQPTEDLPLRIKDSDAYTDEIVDFINCIKNDGVSTVNPCTESLVSLEIALAEKKSADTNSEIKF